MKMSGRTAGARYKVYVEESTGKKFYSKREALDYLKASSSSSPEIKNVQSVTSEECPDWLPPGWTVQTEIESGGRIAERKDKVYVDSITGMKFCTKKEVFDYLNNMSSSGTKNRENAEPVSDFGDQTDQVRDTEREETIVEGLPPGWVKAIRYKETRAGIRNKVALYVDPQSGYAFFSTKDALRYIDNGHIKVCRVKPVLWNEISMNSPGNKFHSQPTGEERELRSERKKGKRPLFTKEDSEWKSEENIIEIEDSDEESGSKLREENRPLLSEENCKMKSEDVNVTDNSPIEKAGLDEKEQGKVPEATPPKRTRFKVLASKKGSFLRSSKSTSAKPLTSKPSSVGLTQTSLKTIEGDSESKQKTEIPTGESVNEASVSSLLGGSPLDPCLEFAFKTLTEDVLISDKT